MTQFPYDQFIKDYLSELLQDYGEVTHNLKVAPEIKEIDVFEDVELMKISTIYLEKLEQVKNEGLQQGEFLVVMRLLRRKLGEIPPAIETRIANSSTTELENLAEALLDFNNLEDLLNWLN